MELDLILRLVLCSREDVSFNILSEYLGRYQTVILLVNSQVHTCNFQKLKNISLKAVNFLATKPKVTCLSETVFFHLHIPELLQFSRPCG